MDRNVVSGDSFLWVILWQVFIFSYRRFGTTYRDHLQGSAFPDMSIKFKSYIKVFQYGRSSPFDKILNYQCRSVTFSNYIHSG